MSYPTHIMISLVEIGGGSCGSLSQRVAWIPDANPPKYQKDGTGDFLIANLTRTTVSGNTTWTMYIRNLQPGSCQGTHSLLRATAADDPTGDFYVINAGQPDSSLGIAIAVNDD